MYQTFIFLYYLQIQSSLLFKLWYKYIKKIKNMMDKFESYNLTNSNHPKHNVKILIKCFTLKN